MASFNRVVIMGNLGQDPEVKTFDNGSSVTNLSVATTRKWKDKDGNPQEKTNWHRVKVWGKQGENCAKFLAKGRGVLVEGELDYDQYEKDGHKMFATNLVASNVQFLPGNKPQENQAEPPPFC